MSVSNLKKRENFLFPLRFILIGPIANNVFRPYDNETKNVKKKNGDEIKFF